MASKKPATPEPPKSVAVVKREASANNYIAAVLGISLVIVLVCGFVAKGLIGSVIQNSKLILKQNQAKADLDKKLQDIPTLLSNYDALGSRKDLIIHALPTTADFPQIVSIAQSMSANAGVQLRSVSPIVSDAPASGNGATPYQFSVELGGAYPQVVQFFRNVELSVRPMKVVSTDFSGAEGTLRVSAVLSTYYQDKAKVDDGTEVLK